MKKIIITLSFTLVANILIAQNFISNLWCVDNFRTEIDSVTLQPYTVFTLNNNDTTIDTTISWDYVAIKSVISNNDTINLPNNNSNHKFAISNTYIELRFDTLITLPITGVIISRGIPSCGMFWLEDVVITQFCEGLSFPLSIKDELIKSNFNIFPNPAENFIEISTLIGQDDVLKIYNINGQLIFNKKINAKTKLDVSYFKKGVYLFNIGNITKQVLIK